MSIKANEVLESNRAPLRNCFLGSSMTSVDASQMKEQYLTRACMYVYSLYMQDIVVKKTIVRNKHPRL